jgi:glutamate synthase domain-containing protein 3
VNGIETTLFGEANDSVCKAMSGGLAVIRPKKEALFRPEENAIIGNCALYGATGGRLYVNGLAGDRFAVRNSGAIAVVEGTGLHACEYMTNGMVVILGPVSKNVGAGMTGGSLILYGDQGNQINREYLSDSELSDADLADLNALLKDYHKHTASNRAQAILNGWDDLRSGFRKYEPVKKVAKGHDETIKTGAARDEMMK